MKLCFRDSGYHSVISDVSEVSNIIIAVISLGLAYYIFVYQKNKDKKDKQEQKQKEQDDKLEASRLQEQNIRLQWFKELVIHPQLSNIDNFYSQLHTLEKRINSSLLDNQRKIELNEFVKEHHAFLRKNFADVLQSINPQLYYDITINLDALLDNITNSIFNDKINLQDKATYEREIGAPITYSRNDLITKIYNYKGIP